MLRQSQEIGMLQQAAFSLLSTFVYNHEFVLKNQDIFKRFVFNQKPNNILPFPANNIVQAQFRFGDLDETDPGINVLLNMMSDYNSSVLHQFVRAIFSMYKDGVRAMAPSKHLCETMALTQANYDAGEFHLPYPCTIIELPIEFRSKFLLKPYMDEVRKMPNFLTAINEYYGVDFLEIEKTGMPPRYLILMEHEHDEFSTDGVINFEEYKTFANRTLTVVLASEISFRKMICPLLTVRRNDSAIYPSRILNPMEMAIIQRPLFKGMTLHKVLTILTGQHGDSKYEKEMMDEDQHSVVQMILLCCNICHALTHMGMEVKEKEQVVNKKLIERGSQLAHRCIPTLIVPAITIINESKRTISDDTSSETNGKIISPHYRIGHFRRQHFGSGGLQIKTVWIAPTLVNKHLLADPEACVLSKKVEE